ncbi:hypothetical protein FN846DRAFT_945223 [Sphaerosporella brunnea]|uniref:Secreted protein n=1 Tax=Sphaerosporella brunnea TaxID=1250544 RepID=A0A5J5EZQ7_9PEZI|nr:hypothetical protein FN846DRAFT_945223 [Sphaerosporella brunnea]
MASKLSPLLFIHCCRCLPILRSVARLSSCLISRRIPQYHLASRLTSSLRVDPSHRSLEHLLSTPFASRWLLCLATVRGRVFIQTIIRAMLLASPK